MLAHLFMFSNGTRYERVRDKFQVKKLCFVPRVVASAIHLPSLPLQEANCQKLDRIVELHIKFAEKIAAHESDDREEDDEALQSVYTSHHL